jgi:restriction system protein
LAKVTTKRKGELLQGVFQVLAESPEGLPARDVLARVQSIVPPNEFEQTEYESEPGTRRYEKMIRFATIGPVKAGWLDKNKGEWSLTEKGLEAYKKYTDPEKFIRQANRLYRAWKADQPEAEEEVSESDETSATIEEAEEAAWREISDHLENINPYDFQQVVAGLVRGMGYHIQWVSPPGPDKGVDVVATTDPLGVTGPRLMVQVKRQKDSVSVSGVRSFLAVLGDNDVGLFVCTGGFTKDAETEARHQEKRRIVLLDAKRFFDRWIEFYEKIPESNRALVPIRPVWYLAPN